MKLAVILSLLLACSGVLLGDSPDNRGASLKPPSLLQDLARLTKAGLSEETVLAYARAHRGELPPKVSTDQLLWLRKSGVGETVIRYMAAIDVRASETDAEDVVADDSGRAARYSARADYGDDSDRDYGNYGSYAESSDDGYPDSYDAGYPDSYSAGYPASYYNDYYPVYGAGYYPYPVYFFANYGGFSRRFHRHGRGFGGRHGFDNGHHGSGRPRHSRGDFDRGRGAGHRNVVAGYRGPARSMSPRGGFGRGQGFAGPRGAVIQGGGGGRRSFSGPTFGSGRGAPAPRGAVVHNGGFRSQGFSGGGGRSPAVVNRAPMGGGGGARGPVARSSGGGGRPAVGRR